MVDGTTPPRLLGPARRRLGGWTGCWVAVALLVGWQLGASACALAASPAAGLSSGVARALAAWAPLALLHGALGTAAWAAAAGRPGRRVPGHRARDGRTLLPWLVLGCALGWRGAAAGPVTAPAAPDAAAFRSFLEEDGPLCEGGWSVLRVERIDWTRTPPAWTGRLHALAFDGRWLVRARSLPVAGSWATPESGGFLARVRARPGTGGTLRLQVVRAFRLTGRAGEGTRSFAARSARLRMAWAARAERAMGKDAGALAARTLLGPCGPTSAEWDRPFRETGTLHLLSISGFHLTLIGGILWLLFRLATRGARGAIWPALAALAVYAFFVGGPSPVLRSLGAALFLAFGPAWGRSARFWNALGWTAALLPVFDPGVPRSVSFQLSFTAMAGVLLGAEARLPAVVRRAAGKRRKPNAAVEATTALLKASAGATLLTGPWSLHHFGVIYPFGIVANLVAIPGMAITLAVQAVALAAVVAGAGAGFPLVAIGRACGDSSLAGLRLLAAGSRHCVWIGGLSYGEALAWTLLFAAVLVAAGRRWRRSRGGAGVLGAGAAAVAIAAAGNAWFARPIAAAPCAVQYLDVGQGDGLLLRFGRRRWAVDLGIGSLGGRRDRLVPQLLRAGVGRLERVWLTHGDADHWGGLADLLASPVRVDTLVLARGAPFPADFWRTLASAPRRPVVLRACAPWTREFPGGTRVRLLHPEDLAGAAAGELPEGMNEWSFVFLLEGPAEDGASPARPERGEAAGGRPGRRFRILLSGDLERPREPALLRSLGAAGPVTVAQLAHHGSRTAGSQAWWGALRPLAGTISVGAGNSYGLPHRETLDAAARSGAVVLRTDRHGVIKLALDDARIEVRTERRPPPACPRPPPVL